MSKLAGLRAKPIKCVIENVEFELNSLTVGELAEFAQLQEKKDLKAAIEYMIVTTLKHSVPDATDDELQNLSPPVVAELIGKIVELNGLNVKKKVVEDAV